MLAPHAGIHDAVRFGLQARLDELLANDPSLATTEDTLGQTSTDIALAVGREDLVERLRVTA